MSTGALAGQVDWNNTYNTELGIGGTFTGTPPDVSKFASVTLSCKTDQAGMLYADIQQDAVMPRITVCSANNIAVIAGYDPVLVGD